MHLQQGTSIRKTLTDLIVLAAMICAMFLAVIDIIELGAADQGDFARQNS